MKIGIIISQSDPETVWYAFRFGNYSLDRGHGVKVFLIGKGVGYEDINDKGFNVKEQVEKFLDKNGENFACETSLESSKKESSPEHPLSTMKDLMNIVEESDRVLSF
ncbi:MAG: DsrE family protein [Nanobdellota archaeon]